MFKNDNTTISNKTSPKYCISFELRISGRSEETAIATELFQDIQQVLSSAVQIRRSIKYFNSCSQSVGWFSKLLRTLTIITQL